MALLIIGGQLIENWKKLHVTITFRQTEKESEKEKEKENRIIIGKEDSITGKDEKEKIGEEEKTKDKIQKKNDQDNFEQKENKKDKEGEGEEEEKEHNYKNIRKSKYLIIPKNTRKEEIWVLGFITLNFQVFDRKDEKKDLHSLQNNFDFQSLQKLLSDAHGGSLFKNTDENKKGKKLKIITDSRLDPEIFECWIPCSVISNSKYIESSEELNYDFNVDNCKKNKKEKENGKQNRKENENENRNENDIKSKNEWDEKGDEDKRNIHAKNFTIDSRASDVYDVMTESLFYNSNFIDKVADIVINDSDIIINDTDTFIDDTNSIISDNNTVIIDSSTKINDTIKIDAIINDNVCTITNVSSKKDNEAAPLNLKLEERRFNSPKKLENTASTKNIFDEMDHNSIEKYNNDKKNNIDNINIDNNNNDSNYNSNNSDDYNNSDNSDDDNSDNDRDLEKEQIKKKRASLIAISSAALLSSMVEDDLQQYSYIMEWKEKHRLKKNRRLHTKESFFSRISKSFNFINNNNTNTDTNYIVNNDNKANLIHSSKSVRERERPKEKEKEKEMFSRSGSILQPRLRVLLIEDSLASQKATSLFLKTHGCDVITVLNGKLGLKCMKTKQFDVCFIDFFTVRSLVVFLLIL